LIEHKVATSRGEAAKNSLVFFFPLFFAA